MKRERSRIVCLIAVALLWAGPVLALDPGDKCEALKNKAAGKFALCMQKVYVQWVKNGGGIDFEALRAKCVQKFARKWQKAEDKGQGHCPGYADMGAIDAFVQRHTEAVWYAFGMGEIPGFIPATGQTQCYTPSHEELGGIFCGDAAQDGSYQWGPARWYESDAGGTTTDQVTGLTWALKCDEDPENLTNATCPQLHDVDTAYTWQDAFDVYIDGLNDPNTPGGCFAGYCDWRLPNVSELQSLVNYGTHAPAVDSQFRGCSPTCGFGDPGCSCTLSTTYWSSTTNDADFSQAWAVQFATGGVQAIDKVGYHFVRAVRGGSVLFDWKIDIIDPNSP